MASGDWGGGGAKVPRMVKRDTNVMENAKMTMGETEPIQGEAPVLKYYPSPVFYKDPVDPEFVRNKAEGRKGYGHGQ